MSRNSPRVLFNERLCTLLALTGSRAIALADPTYGSTFSWTSYPPIFCVFTSNLPRFASQRGHYHPVTNSIIYDEAYRFSRFITHSGRRAPDHRITPREVADRRPPMFIHLSDSSFQPLTVHCPNFGRFDSGMFHSGRWGCSMVSSIRIRQWGAKRYLCSSR